MGAVFEAPRAGPADHGPMAEIRPPLLLAHRGHVGGKAAIENSIAAFAAARALGADGIETDLRLSADGQIVLVHDAHLPGGRPVARLTRAELEARLGRPVATLEGALTAWRRAYWNLEVKAPGVVEPLLEILRAAPPPGGCLVSSFDHSLLLPFVDLARVRAAALVGHLPLTDTHPWQRLRDAGVSALVLPLDLASSDLMAGLAESGFALFAYGAETAAQHERALSWPLAGLISDDIALARTLPPFTSA